MSDPNLSVQYNNNGTAAGDASFVFTGTTSKVVGIGPQEAVLISEPSNTVPRIQVAGSSLVSFATYATSSFCGMAYIDNPTTIDNEADEEDGIVIARNYNPSSTADHFSINGLLASISTEPTNTQNQSQAYLSAVTSTIFPAAATPHGTVQATLSTVYPYCEAGGTQSFVEIDGLYTETLFGATGSTATYNVTQACGINVGTTGFEGAQSGVITSSSGILIEGPRLGSGTGSFGSRYGIFLQSQNQGNPGGRNPNSWAIFEDDQNDRNAMGTINIGGSSGPLISSGYGSPNGVLTAPVGSLYLNVQGGAGTTLWIKESGTGNTGWVGK